jgi:aminoglycoside phosphotransferase (APT) family kinase protein
VSGRTAGIADALRIASGCLDGEVHVIRRVGSFAANRVYRVRTDTETVYVKLAAAEDIGREATVLRVLSHHGVPVPEVLAAGLADGVPHLVTREVAGQPLSAEDAGALRDVLAVVHELPVRGFGSVQSSTGEGAGDSTLVAPQATWAEVIVSRAESARLVVDARRLDEALYLDVLSSIQDHQAQLAAVTQSRLLHGDLSHRHAYVDERGRITAIIDWGDATAGDPRYDTARLVHAAVGTHGLDEALRLASASTTAASPPAPRSLLLLYGAVFVLWSMHGELTSGDPYEPWFPVQVENLTTLLRGIERA